MFFLSTIWPFLMLLIGICFGSFVTMASYRLPREMGIVRRRSHCTACETSLTARDLVPVLSWVFSKGKCRHCQHSISVRYPLTEVFLGGLFVLLAVRYGVTVEMGVLALFTTALLTLFIADLETGLIPDELHLFLIPLGAIYHILIGSDLVLVTMAAFVALGLGLLLHYGYYWLRGKHGLGFGDVKFLAVVGVWLGALHPLTVFLFTSGLIGVLMGVVWRVVFKQERFPFGPALVISLFLLVIYPQSAEWFWQMIRRLIT